MLARAVLAEVEEVDVVEPAWTADAGMKKRPRADCKDERMASVVAFAYADRDTMVEIVGASAATVVEEADGEDGDSSSGKEVAADNSASAEGKDDHSASSEDAEEAA